MVLSLTGAKVRGNESSIILVPAYFRQTMSGLHTGNYLYFVRFCSYFVLRLFIYIYIFKYRNPERLSRDSKSGESSCGGHLCAMRSSSGVARFSHNSKTTSNATVKFIINEEHIHSLFQ